MSSRDGRLALDVCEVYTSHLPTHVIEDSCVFHTPKGCSLPRHLRADTCNSFECDGLRNLLRQFHEHGQQQFCLFARSPHKEPRIVFIDVDGDGMVHCVELDEIFGDETYDPE